MIRGLKGEEVDIAVFFEKDSSTKEMVRFLLSKIQEVKSNGFNGDELVCDYNTYNFFFSENSMTVSGLMADEPDREFKLSEFIEELERMRNQKD